MREIKTNRKYEKERPRRKRKSERRKIKQKMHELYKIDCQNSSVIPQASLFDEQV